jgi:hypothetical protein
MNEHTSTIKLYQKCFYIGFILCSPPPINGYLRDLLYLTTLLMVLLLICSLLPHSYEKNIVVIGVKEAHDGTRSDNMNPQP